MGWKSTGPKKAKKPTKNNWKVQPAKPKPLK